MDTINLILAKLFDQFKTANPKIAAIVILVLGTLIYWSQNGLGDLIGVNLAEVVKWASIVLGFLTGSRTTAILAGEKK